jgi:hypothetical protein
LIRFVVGPSIFTVGVFITGSEGGVEVDATGSEAISRGVGGVVELVVGVFGAGCNHKKLSLIMRQVICDPTPQNESLCTFEKREKKVKQIFLVPVYMMYFVKIRAIAVPRYDNCTPNML